MRSKFGGTVDGIHDGATRAAIVSLMEAVRSVGKGQRNDSQGFQFRGIDDVLNAVGPAIRDCHITVKPRVQEIKHEVRALRGDRTINHYIVRVDYDFQVPHGEVHTVEAAGEAMDSGDKGLSKAQSVAYRTALIQMLALPTGERDPDKDTYEIDGEPQGQTYGAPEPRAESSEAVNALRKEILRVLTSRRPPWTLPQIERDFDLQIGGQIRDAPAEKLQAYLDLVKQ